MSDFYIKQGDLLPNLVFTFLDLASGQPLDLTGATLEFHMRDLMGQVVINRAAVVDDPPTAGQGHLAWIAGDTAVAGIFEFEVEGTIGGKPFTAPNYQHGRILISPEIA